MIVYRLGADDDASLLRAWAGHPVNAKLLQDAGESLNVQVKALINAARACSDPRVVQMAERCYNLEATMLMLSGAAVEKVENVDG